MAFFSTAAELTRRCEQNKNDIEEIYKQGKKTDANVERLTTEVGNLTVRVGDVEAKVDNLTTRVGNVETKVDNLTTRVGNVETKLDNLTTRVGNVETKVDNLTSEVGDLKTRVDERFNRLERILTQAPMVDPSSPLDFLPSEHEQSIRLLESKMNLFSNQTRENTDELARLRQLHATHDERFTKLDGQMTEVLEILRAKSA